MAAGCSPSRDVLHGDSQTRGRISSRMGQSSPGVMQREVVVPAGLQQGTLLTPLKGASRFCSSLSRVIVADPVPKTGGSFPHHRQHPDECAELPVPRHLHHSPVPDESVHPPRAGEMCFCLMAGLFLDLIPRQCVWVPWKGERV